MAEKKTVLVIGGGYAGLSVCKALQHEASVHVILVDPREGFLLHKFSALRAATFANEWIPKTLIPNNKFKNITIKQARLMHIDSAAQTAKLSTDEEEVHYDALVMCTGARNFSPGEPPMSITSVADTHAYFQRTHDCISKAEKILIYGSGLVAIEFAGEILDRYAGGKKTVLMVKPRNHTLCGAIALTAKQESNLLHLITSNRNFHFIADEEIKFPALPDMDWTEAEPCVEMPEDNKQVQFTSGRQVKGVDLVVFCMGGRFALGMVNMVPNGWLHVQSGEIKITNTFQIEGCENAFALGDVAKTGHAKLGYMHMSDAPLVAENVKRFLHGQPCKPSTNVDDQTENKKLTGALVGITFGRSKGRLFKADGTTRGNWWTTYMKSRNLFVDRYTKEFAS